jgi:hypothetical protein
LLRLSGEEEDEEEDRCSLNTRCSGCAQVPLSGVYFGGFRPWHLHPQANQTAANTEKIKGFSEIFWQPRMHVVHAFTFDDFPHFTLSNWSRERDTFLIRSILRPIYRTIIFWYNALYPALCGVRRAFQKNQAFCIKKYSLLIVGNRNFKADLNRAEFARQKCYFENVVVKAT